MPEYVGGIDLGQTQDPSALCVLEKGGVDEAAVYTMLVLRRYELKTSYPAILTDAAQIMADPPLTNWPLAVDQTGVGRPWVDFARERMPKTPIFPVTFTGGHAVTRGDDGGYHVPKVILVNTLLMVHQSKRLVVLPRLRHGPTLCREMENFRVKTTRAGNEQFEAWREGMHDDLVFAVALAVWLGEKFLNGPWDFVPDPRAKLEWTTAPPGVFHESGRRGRDDDDAGNEGDDVVGFGGGLEIPHW